MTLQPTIAPAGLRAAPGGGDGSLITAPGQLQYGDVLMGAGTSAGWRDLVGWRDSPEAQAADTDRPQAHGAYPGDVYGTSLVVTFVFLLRGSPADKLADLEALELYAPMDGVERALAVNDGGPTTYRMARVIGRQVPMGVHFTHAPLECSLQFLCADPRRYALDPTTVELTLPVGSGGLTYPLEYPLTYGSYSTGGAHAVNGGSVASPIAATFRGPLTNPRLTSDTWALGFDLNLADGEQLVVSAAHGTAKLNGTADRLYTITASSDPLELCQIPPGETGLTLGATAGTGSATVTYRDARM